MSTINIDLAADTILNVMIGQQDENEVREVVFDFSGWYTTYGSGTISLAIQRPKDEWPYEGTLTVDSTNHKATWEISETDTAYAGTGQIQLSYKVGDAKKKSVVYRFTCHKSLGALGSVVTPVQIQTFIDEVEEALQTMDGKLDDMEDEITDVKADLAELEGGGVPTNVRQALKTLLESAAYADTGLTDEMAVVSSWASAVTAITLNHSSISISGATTSQLTATTTPSGGTVTWSSSDTSVATVSSSGLVTGVSNGTATITATSGNVFATCSVTVSGIATLSSISAVYTQTGTIYDTDDLDDILTAGTLVVTATYSDSSTATVASTDYTLSGTLTVGTSTITVTYGEKTATFTVTVTEYSIPALYKWENLGNSLVDSIEGLTATTTGTQDSANGCVKFNSEAKYIDFGEIYAYDRTYEIEFGASTSTNTSGHARFFGVDADSNTAQGGSVFAYRGSNGFCFYTGSWGDTLISGTDKRNMFANSKLSVYIDSAGKAHAYKDGELIGSTGGVFKASASGLHVYIGSSSADYLYTIEIKSMTVYSGEVV